MAQTKKSTKKPAPSKSKSAVHNKAAAEKPPRRREIGAVVCLLLAIFALIGFFDADAIFIGFFRTILSGLFGYGFYAWPFTLLLAAAILGFHRGRPVALRLVCALLLGVVLSALLHLFISGAEYSLASGAVGALWSGGRALDCGGVVGGLLAESFEALFSKTGAGILFICVFLLLLLLSLNKTIAGLADAFKNRKPRPEYTPAPEPAAPKKPEPVNIPEPTPVPKKRRRGAIDIPLDDPDAPKPEPPKSPEEVLKPRQDSFFNPTPNVKTPDQILAEPIPEPEPEPEPEPKPEPEPDNIESAEYPSEDIPLDVPFMDKPLKPVGKAPKPEPVKKPKVAPPEPKPAQKQDTKPVPPEEFEAEIALNQQSEDGEEYIFPPVTLLATEKGPRLDASEEIRLNCERLETTFRSFGINVTVTNYTRGPSVTRYEAELEAGIKLSRLTNLSEDVALALGVGVVRIAAMPNRISTVGIEVPNKIVSNVYLRDVIDSSAFRDAKSKLTFAIGKNIGGDAIVGNIAKLPHLLVAGTTGSGKSVCLNSLILSILYKATPEEVRFIMIDPKMVEFRVYNGIPHLLVPVVTEVKKAAGALQWAVVEMMKRYRLFSEMNVREIDGYNVLMRREEDGQVLPRVVVVIDELADLMLTAAKEVEESIVRIAQMGRAAGIHLVIATQSPRADVITGLMKANIPSRIALRVSSALESRIILDAGGSADKLVGNGDMLYAPVGITKPTRIQGTWVTDEEREEIVGFIKKRAESQYSEDVISQINKAAEEKGSEQKNQENEPPENDYDELLPQAVDVIFESGQASVSMLQRRLKLGYSRAARIVDQMEEMGIIGPFGGAKPRALLITKEQWHEMQFVNGTAPIDTMPERDDFADLAAENAEENLD